MIGLISSWYFFSDQITDPSGRLMLTEHEPFRYRERRDNLFITVGEGASWDGIAEAYYGHISDRACGLYRALLDYQVPPIVDPTIPPRPGSVVIVPSSAAVTEFLSQKPEVFL
jgi:hypothetical protein